MTQAAGPLTEVVSGPRHRLRSSVESFVNRDGELCLVRPGGQDAVVRDPEELDIELVDELRDRWQTADALAQRFGCDRRLIQHKLDALVAADLVVVSSLPAEPPLAGDDAERFSRQLPYLAELGDEAGLQRRLRASTVVVIGCGGLGTWVVATLACIGVGRVVVVDDDRVELSNLNRQILYTRGDIGESKAASVARWLEAFDPSIETSVLEHRIASSGDVAPLANGADVVVLAADWPPYEIGRWVNEACVAARVPFIVAGQLPPLIKVGPTYMPGEGPCWACHETAVADASHAYEDYVAFRSSRPITAATIGPASCVAGGLMGLELLHLLTGHGPATRDAALLVDMRTLTVRREHIQRDPACCACKDL